MESESKTTKLKNHTRCNDDRCVGWSHRRLVRGGVSGVGGGDEGGVDGWVRRRSHSGVIGGS